MNTSLFAAEKFTVKQEESTAEQKKAQQEKDATWELVWAVKNGNPKEARTALRAGARVNGNHSIGPHGEVRGSIPLTEACRCYAEYNKAHALSKSQARKYLATIALLLEHKALITAVDHQGHTAVSYSCNNGQIETLALLLKHGAPYEEENQTTITDRMVNKEGLWLSDPLNPLIKSLPSTVEKHTAKHKDFREADPELNALLKAHKDSFVIKRVFNKIDVK